MEPITEKEQQSLVQFRSAINDLNLEKDQLEDHFLIRWLRARNLDVKKATEMLSNYVEWRRSSEVLHTVALDKNWVAPQPILDHLKFKITGVDHEGRLIIWSNPGRWELPYLIEQGLSEDMIRYGYQAVETIMAALESQRKLTGASKMVVLFDTAGVTLRKITNYPATQLRNRFFREFEMYYPEILHTCYVVNAHWVVTWLYTLLKPFLSKHTQSKVNLYDTNETKWRAVLTERLPPSSIPEDYGGTAPPVLSEYSTSSS